MKSKLVDALVAIGTIACGAWLIALIALSGKPGPVIFGAVLGVVAGIVVALLGTALVVRREFEQEQRAKQERKSHYICIQGRYHLVEPHLLTSGRQEITEQSN